MDTNFFKPWEDHKAKQLHNMQTIFQTPNIELVSEHVGGCMYKMLDIEYMVSGIYHWSFEWRPGEPDIVYLFVRTYDYYSI